MRLRENLRLPTRFVIAAGIVIACGCASDSGMAERYLFEQEVWASKTLERQIWADPLKSDYRQIDVAIASYERLMIDNPLTRGSADSPDSKTRRDVERLLLHCRIALMNLYFLRYEGNASVTYFRTGAADADPAVRHHLNPGLELTRSLYASFREDRFEARCVELFAEVSQDEVLWRGEIEIGDTLLEVPIELVRSRVERGATSEADELAKLTGLFFGRIMSTFPDSLVAHKARVSRAKLNIVLGRFGEALADLVEAGQIGYAVEDEEEIRLLHGQVLAFGLGRFQEADSLFGDLVAEHPGTSISSEARLAMASLRLFGSKNADAVAMLRELELEPGGPAEVTSAAMLLRAVGLEQSRQHDEARALLWRISRMHPATSVGAAAPIVLLRWDSAGERRRALAKDVEKASEFYTSLIEKEGVVRGQRHILEDCLIESFLLTGDSRGAAVALERWAPGWMADNGSVGLLKSAVVYLNLVDDRENGVRVLQKCLDVFPGSRYSGFIRDYLDTLSSPPTVQ